jgi:hypothetical protein
MPRTALHFNDRALGRGATAVDEHALRGELILERLLGSGGSGAAYLAHFRGETVVVKLPVRLLNDSAFSGDVRGRHLKDVLNARASVHDFLRAQDAMAIECRNAQHALDAPDMQRIRAATTRLVRREIPEQHRLVYNAHKEVRDDWADIERIASQTGHPMPNLTASEHAAVTAARQRWASLPGYAHLHPVIHYDRDIPLLMSLPAQDTIEALRMCVGPTSAVPETWFDVAWQLSEAIEFLRLHPKLAHVDIKPANVLFLAGAGQRVHIWLSDYGDLFDPNERTDFYYGTALYKPERTLQPGLMHMGATYGEHSLYMYFSTLIDLFVPTDPHTDPRMSWYFEMGHNIGLCVMHGDLPPTLTAFFGGHHHRVDHAFDLTELLLAPVELRHFKQLTQRFQHMRYRLRARLP